MDLEKILRDESELQKLERFDFSAEYAAEEYVNASGAEKYIIYKTYTLNAKDSDWPAEFEKGKAFKEAIREHYTKRDERNKRKFKSWIQDPDEFGKAANSLLAQIYKMLWPELELCSDTMTSVQYSMAAYFESEIETPEEKRARAEISEDQPCSLMYMINWWGQTEGEPAKKIEEAAKRLDHKNEGVNSFLAAWHTLGNYCPVPKGFNGPRSNFGKHDFWDLTLMMIRKWYLTEDELLKERMLREDLFHCRARGGAAAACVKWLNLCGGKKGTGEARWENFVRKLCFEDWVNLDRDSSEYEYYEVIPLWKGHGWDHALPPVHGWNGFFEEYNRRILARTRRLIKRLSEAGKQNQNIAVK